MAKTKAEYKISTTDIDARNCFLAHTLTISIFNSNITLEIQINKNPLHHKNVVGTNKCFKVSVDC